MSEQLGNMLMERGLLTAEQLKAAELARQIGDFRRGIDPGDPMAKILVLMGFAKPSDVATSLTQIMGVVAYVLVNGFPVDPLLPSAIKREVMEANSALPLLKDGKNTAIVVAEKPLPQDIAKQYADELDVKYIEYLPLAATEVQSLLKAVFQVLDKRKVQGVRLGEILVREGLLSAEDLEPSLKAARSAGLPLGRYLVKSKKVQEEAITKLLAGMADIPFLTMDEAMQRVKQSSLRQRLKKEYVRFNTLLPIEAKNRVLLAITANPFIKAQELPAAYDCLRLELLAVTESTFAAIFSNLYGEALHQGEPADLANAADEDRDDSMSLTLDENDIRARYEHLVNRIILKAIEVGSSDIHIENYETGVQVRLRVDGVLHVVPDSGINKDTLRGVMNILKIEGGMNITENRMPQGGSFRKIAPDGSPFDFRVQIMPGVAGETAVVRLLPGKKRIPTLAEIGFPELILQGFSRSVNNPSGLILVTGPTGSGKTTTLCSALAYVAQDPTCKVLTVEDPVEYQLPNVTQIETIPSKGVDFSAAARGFMRMDPDVILIGEIRDQETAQEALKLAYSGHLTFSTLHTSSAVATVERMYGFGLDRLLLIEQMLAIMSQRLMRRLCPYCREPYTPVESDMRSILYQGVLPGMRFFQAKGCERCNGLGHMGRALLAEFLNFTGNTRATFRRESEQNLIYVQLMGQGLEPMIDDAFNKVHQGYVDVRWLSEVIPQDYLEMGPSSRINIGPEVPIFQPK